MAQNKITKTEFVVVGIFLLLCLIPILAGIYRLWMLYTGNTAIENSRFLNMPAPVVIHILAMIIYAPLSLMQFVPSLRSKLIRYHKKIGSVLVVAGLLVAISGLWMTQFYPRTGYDGFALYLLRWVVGLLILFSFFSALRKLLKRQFTLHGDWMLRAYALSMGAGTQVLTHIPLYAFPTTQSEHSRFWAMASGWCINVILAEWIIQKNKTIYSQSGDVA